MSAKPAAGHDGPNSLRYLDLHLRLAWARDMKSLSWNIWLVSLGRSKLVSLNALDAFYKGWHLGARRAVALPDPLSLGTPTIQRPIRPQRPALNWESSKIAQPDKLC